MSGLALASRRRSIFPHDQRRRLLSLDLGNNDFDVIDSVLSLTDLHELDLSDNALGNVDVKREFALATAPIPSAVCSRVCRALWFDIFAVVDLQRL